MTTNQYGSEYDQYIDGHYTDNRKPQDENLLNKVELTKDEIYKETKEKQLKELREKYNYRYTYIQEEIKSRFYDPGASSQQDYYRLLQTEYAQSLIIDFVIRQNSKEGIKKVFSTDNPNLVAEAKQINTNYGDVIEDAYNCIAGDNGIVTQNGVDSKLWKDLTKNGTDRETMDVDNISSIQIEVQYNRTDEQEVCETETTTADVKETTTSKNNVRIKKDKNSSENSFVRLLHHSKKARGNFDIIDVWFFESMEETTAIADLVDLLKYLFYLVYNKDYGVSTDEKDYIDLFNPEKFSSISNSGSSVSVSGTSKLSVFLQSWENAAVKQYLDGTGSYESASRYITQDKKNYIMFDDGYGTMNYGFGVCISPNGGATYYHVEYFREEGIDITDSKYHMYNTSTLPVEIVDRVKERVMEDKREDVRNTANGIGVKLEDYQVDALAACRYQGWYIEDLLISFKQNGLNEGLRSLCGGFHANGSISASRAEANWVLFSTGKYMDEYGNEIVLK